MKKTWGMWWGVLLLLTAVACGSRKDAGHTDMAPSSDIDSLFKPFEGMYVYDSGGSDGGCEGTICYYNESSTHYKVYLAPNKKFVTCFSGRYIKETTTEYGFGFSPTKNRSESDDSLCVFGDYEIVPGDTLSLDFTVQRILKTNNLINNAECFEFGDEEFIEIHNDEDFNVYQHEIFNVLSAFNNIPIVDLPHYSPQEITIGNWKRADEGDIDAMSRIVDHLTQLGISFDPASGDIATAAECKKSSEETISEFDLTPDMAQFNEEKGYFVFSLEATEGDDIQFEFKVGNFRGGIYIYGPDAYGNEKITSLDSYAICDSSEPFNVEDFIQAASSLPFTLEIPGFQYLPSIQKLERGVMVTTNTEGKYYVVVGLCTQSFSANDNDFSIHVIDKY